MKCPLIEDCKQKVSRWSFDFYCIPENDKDEKGFLYCIWLPDYIKEKHDPSKLPKDWIKERVADDL